MERLHYKGLGGTRPPSRDNPFPSFREPILCAQQKNNSEKYDTQHKTRTYNPKKDSIP